MTKSPEVGDSQRLKDVVLDGSLAPSSSPDIEHERKVAIYDLIESNSFKLPSRDDGPYILRLSIAEGRLLLDIANAAGAPCIVIGLALSPFRRIIKDYFMICESYYRLFAHPLRARSRRSTWPGAACTMREAKS